MIDVLIFVQIYTILQIYTVIQNKMADVYRMTFLNTRFIFSFLSTFLVVHYCSNTSESVDVHVLQDSEPNITYM